MERTIRSGDRRAYASAVAGLWGRLGTALARLERIAETPAEHLGDEVLEELPPLQYSLHASAELALGIAPPRGAEHVHAEFVTALAQARDATAQIALALHAGDHEQVERALPEWRGALFRVRLARLRALERFPLEGADRPALPAPAPEGPRGTSPLVVAAAVALVVGGALLFTAGAVLAAWPLWAAGLGLFASGFVLFRP